jgi:hypothetical protein
MLLVHMEEKRIFLDERPQFRLEEKAEGGIILGYPHGKT